MVHLVLIQHTSESLNELAALLLKHGILEHGLHHTLGYYSQCDFN